MSDDEKPPLTPAEKQKRYRERLKRGKRVFQGVEYDPVYIEFILEEAEYLPRHVDHTPEDVDRAFQKFVDYLALLDFEATG